MKLAGSEDEYTSHLRSSSYAMLSNITNITNITDRRMFTAMEPKVSYTNSNNSYHANQDNKMFPNYTRLKGASGIQSLPYIMPQVRMLSLIHI